MTHISGLDELISLCILHAVINRVWYAAYISRCINDYDSFIAQDTLSVAMGVT